jgi:hypothetical protein
MSPGVSALDDEFTALTQAHAVRQARLAAVFITFALMYAASSVWMLIGAPRSVDVIVSVSTPAIWLMIVAMWHSFPPTRFGGTVWRQADKRLLAEHSWRETSVRVLNTRGTVLVLPGGEYVRVGLRPAAREVVVRAGRVFLAGPDDGGRLAVRVDGLHAAWTARRIPPLEATAALPSDDPIATIWLRPLTSPVLPVAFAFVALGSVLTMIGAVLPPWDWGAFARSSAMVVFAVAGWWWIRQPRRLRHTEPWIRAEATVASWRVRWNGLADGTVTLDLPDGRRCTAHLCRAPLDLFADVRQEQVLWVAGNVVGFPHYPVLALAKLSPRT